MIITPARFEDEVEKITDSRPEETITRLIDLMANTLVSLGYESGINKAMDALTKHSN